MKTTELPLSGYRVVDFGWVWAGTVLGHILADHGAEVIKVESRRRLDGMRLGKVFESGDALEANPYFQNLNRNKLGITVDLTQPKGVEILKQLVSKSNIVIENFVPGTLERRGLDYKSLIKVKPDIVMISLSATGQFGPLSQIVAYAPVISALSGMDSLLGYRNEAPLGFKHAYADVVASLTGAFAVLAALRYWRRTGKGQYIDLSQLESTTSLLGEAIMDYTMNGRVQQCQGNYHPGMAPYGNYPCKGDDTWVSIAVKNEDEWEAFCRAIGDPSWARDHKFADIYRRLSNVDELDKLVAQWTRSYTDYEAADILQKTGVAAAPVLDTGGIFLDPHFQQREVLGNVDHPTAGRIVIYNLPWNKSIPARRPTRHAPLLGEHNNYVLGEILGLSPEDIAKLSEDGVTY